MKLTKLVIEKFGSVEPGTTLEFNEGFNVLLGKNATGKTTLLRLVLAVAHGRFEEFNDQRLALVYTMTGTFGETTVRFTNEPEPIELLAPSERLRQRPSLFANQQLTATLTPKDGPVIEVRVTDAVVEVAASGTVLRKDSRRRDLPALWDVALLEERHPDELSLAFNRHWPMPEPLAPIYFDESLHYFDRLNDLECSAYGNGSVSFGAVFPRFMMVASSDFVVDGSLVQEILLTSESTDFLRIVSQRLGFRRAELHMPRLESTRTEGLKGWTYGPPRFLFEAADEAYGADRLSYGQKRMLSFLWYLDSTTGLAACDELVNGLHHEWITDCLNDLKSRQSLLTSQNPLLPDELEFESAEQVRKTFIRCMRQPDGSFRWRNLDEGEARRFFQAYEVGLQHVSEILRDEDLW